MLTYLVPVDMIVASWVDVIFGEVEEEGVTS